MSDNELVMQLPVLQEQKWHLAIDTALQSPFDIIPPEKQVPVKGFSYAVQARSVVVFES